MAWIKVEGLTLRQIEKELLRVYNKCYKPHCDISFLTMVNRFASDDFYRHHFLAKKYLENISQEYIELVGKTNSKPE